MSLGSDKVIHIKTTWTANSTQYIYYRGPTLNIFQIKNDNKINIFLNCKATEDNIIWVGIILMLVLT